MLQLPPVVSLQEESPRTLCTTNEAMHRSSWPLLITLYS
jgi:hypothetical protein